MGFRCLCPGFTVGAMCFIERDDGRLLLVRQAYRTHWGVPGGLLKRGEEPTEAARREVFEEVGVQLTNLRYFDSQPWPFPHSLMIGFTAEHAGGEIRLEESEIADARWFGVDELPQVPPKVSIARRLIDAFVARNRSAATEVRGW